MNCVSCDVCVRHLWFVFVFSEVFLSSRVTGACPVTTDLIMRVNVRTTTMSKCVVGLIFSVHQVLIGADPHRKQNGTQPAPKTLPTLPSDWVRLVSDDELAPTRRA